jgi:hypothetical protein
VLHQRVRYASLCAQRYQSATQRVDDPYFGRAPTRRYKGRSHHPDYRVNLPQLSIQTLLPVLTSANPVPEVVIEERLMTGRPATNRPPRRRSPDPQWHN